MLKMLDNSNPSVGSSRSLQPRPQETSPPALCWANPIWKHCGVADDTGGLYLTTALAKRTWLICFLSFIWRSQVFGWWGQSKLSKRNNLYWTVCIRTTAQALISLNISWPVWIYRLRRLIFAHFPKTFQSFAAAKTYQMEKQCMDFLFWVCFILFFPADIILFVSVKTVQE